MSRIAGRKRRNSEHHRPFFASIYICCIIILSFNIKWGMDVPMESGASLAYPHGCNEKNESAVSDALVSTIEPSDLPDKEMRNRRFWSLKANKRRTLDIGVPVCGQDDKLLLFAKSYADAIQGFNTKVEGSLGPIRFRLLVTRYPSDNSSFALQRVLAKESCLPLDQVLFVPTTETVFHRAHAINKLHNATLHNTTSVLAVTDVDMIIGPRYIFNALRWTTTWAMYFPIVFSEYRPSFFRLVERVLGPQSRYSEHAGLWRDFGFGMYAIAGDNADSFTMQEAFKGWGGEDTNFYERATAKFRIVRAKEYDLVHRWHPKFCDIGTFVTEDLYPTCIGSRDAVEGSDFAKYLLELKGKKAKHFKTLTSGASAATQGLSLRDIEALAKEEYKGGQLPNTTNVVLTPVAPKVRGLESS